MKRSPSPSGSPDRAGSWRRPSALRGPLLLAVALVVAALAAGWIAIASRPDQSPTSTAAGNAVAGAARRYQYLLRPAGRPPARVSLEVAADEPARERGLSRRTEVPAGTGMVFLFPADTTAPFWMKDTLVPLQIAFVAADGRVVSLFEMTPCHADPCSIYAPTSAYRYAVELSSGAFTGAGVKAGDKVVPEDPPSLPRAS